MIQITPSLPSEHVDVEWGSCAADAPLHSRIGGFQLPAVWLAPGPSFHALIRNRGRTGPRRESRGGLAGQSSYSLSA